MSLTQYELRDHAEFVNGASFRLHSNPYATEVPLGLYELPRRSGEAHYYRLGHPLAGHVVAAARSRTLPSVSLDFDYSGHPTNISIVQQLVGQSGWLRLARLTISSLDQPEDHLVWAAVTDNGLPLNEDQSRRLWSVPAEITGHLSTADIPDHLARDCQRRENEILRDISERNAAFFEAEVDKLEAWADDLKLSLEREIKEIDRQIKEARRASVASVTLEEKLAGQKEVRTLENQRNTKRRALFDAQDEIDQRRGELINGIEQKLKLTTDFTILFTVRWRIV